MILNIILFSCSITTSLAFCNEARYLHPQEEAGSACYKEDEGIICDTNKDSLCSKEICEIQRGAFDPYTCATADYYYDENPDEYQLFLENWTPKCCFDEPPEIKGCLSGVVAEFTGECTYDNVLQATGEKGCSEQNLFPYLEASNLTEAQKAIEYLCDSAFSKHVDSFYDFNDISKGGYQFDREFMNGGSEWNNAFNPDISRIQWMEDNIATKGGISFPGYLHNFDTEESCESKTVMCCWIADSTDAGEGTCTDSTGCQNEDPVDNTDVCYVNIENSPLASHTESGVALFPDESEGPANCMGFTWKENEVSDLYKGNLLFEVAMRHGLKNNGYTRSVPHAPMCACVEQMPYVSHADCTDIESNNSWSVSQDSESGLFSLSLSSANIVFNDCNGQGLAAHYEAVHENDSISDRISDCSNFESKIESNHGLKKELNVKWVKVAGKGNYADLSLNEQNVDEGVQLSSMTRDEFEAVWAQSSLQILARKCQFCKELGKLMFYKRYDENGLPPNVDILHDVKEEFKSYENSEWGSDWNLFSSLDDALLEKEPWLHFEDLRRNFVGFPSSKSGQHPNTRISNIYNTWNGRKGQKDVAFYVAIPLDEQLQRS
jgi:hypothetical protein